MGGERREGEDRKGVQECPNPELASLLVIWLQCNSTFNKIRFKCAFWTIINYTIL